MNVETIFSCIMIMGGAGVMFFSMTKAGSILQATSFVPERHRLKLRRYLALHRALMGFFLVGYLAVLVAFAMEIPLVSQLFVSLIFLFGAVFVLMGIVIQSWLLSEVQRTMRGLLPICARCKKIRINDTDVRDPRSWQNIEIYISEKSEVDFSHGLCPDCFHDEMVTLHCTIGRA